MTIRDDARQAALAVYSHANVRDRYDADLMMAGFEDGAVWAAEQPDREPSDTETIEHVARAVKEAHRPWDATELPTWEDDSEAWRETYRDFARAALLAAQEVRHVS